MCPDECSAELRMVSPVSLESRPLEPLRSDLRSWKPFDGSRALGFLSRLPGLSVCFRLSKCRPFSRVLCLVFVFCALFEDFDSPCDFILLCLVDF
ncbi:hypothetical protein NPIL_95371 [Nephila pilipes]|uniref:Uncharacterized protein n=1 Tax=Nephila pilipes TaxID=299642 RepID=A0A8X6PWU2_NEPPI|nr:hypothetical protein NPIL_95371 [Nephila pilipes]